MTLQRTSDLTYNGTPINLESDRVSLTDMWRADGSDDTHRPNDWLNQTQTKAFIEKLAEKLNASLTGICESRPGRHGGTWAHWQVAMEYARYLSPEFAVWCNTTIKAYYTDAPVPTRTSLPNQASMPDLAIARIDRVEEHMMKLVADGAITRRNALDMVSEVIKHELGYDLSKIPTVSKNLLKPTRCLSQHLI